MIEFFKNYFSLPIKQYFYINVIPEYNIAGIFDSLYFYFIIILAIVIIIIFSRIFLIKYRHKINFNKTFLYFLLIFWLITSLRWFGIEAELLKKDFKELFGQNLAVQRTNLTIRAMRSTELPPNWYDLYDFLQFVQKEIPVGKTAYFLPDDNTLKFWTKYWLYPNLWVETTYLFRADYILVFNLEIKEIPKNFEKYREFAPNQFILKKI
ncbi:MAG: hypothetical protein PHE59_04630 [Patescibacteria group bacterium]|nr:hypothetical protein [Patescibacteria group bacterium]MDD5164805.1 hypothetical protein [Patescibacteria group bacterium]MDD5534436.1 hypothetical protein [Patescibacteria group bacterium]